MAYIKRYLANGIAYSWFVLLVFAFWWWASDRSDSIAFPPVQKILSTFRADWLTGESLPYLRSSLINLAFGYGIASVVGVLVGVLLWTIPRRMALQVTPLLYFIYVIPSVALLPAIMVIMGLGLPMKVTIIVIASIWPTLFNTFDGMRGVPPLMLDTARTLHMGKLRIVTSVVLKNALPQVMAGLRYSLQLAVIMMAVSEFVASTSGVGAYILNAQHNFETAEMWAGIIVLGLLGSVTSFGFLTIERRVLFWQQ